MIGKIHGYICALCAVMLLGFSGCGNGMISIMDDRKSDTVVFIPLDPEKEATIPEIHPTQQEATVAPTEMVPDSNLAETEVPSTQSQSGGNSNPAQPTEPSLPPETAPAETVPEPTRYDISGYGVGALEQGLLEQINARRAEHSLPALVLDYRLCAIASARAWELETLWSHTRPNGMPFSTIGADYGYSGYIAAENLYYNGAEPAVQDVVQAWMNGTAQRDHILASGCTVVGIGVYRANGYCYIACLFVG